jgi:mannose-6-phosphate isomerase
MYVLKPLVHETIWGGDRLKSFWHSDKKIGHLYLVNGHKDMSNEILNGDLKGMLLIDAFHDKKEAWGMEEFDEFPLTVALVDASDDLSIQVHPDDLMAQELERIKIGKTESWIFLSPPSNGWIYGGCECKNKKEICRAIEEKRMDDVTSHLHVDCMDCVTVKAGTLHSMTAGSLVYEVEYGGNFTYRFYDFDRRDANGNMRELHIEKAVESIKPEMTPRVERVVKDKWLTESVYEIFFSSKINEYVNHSNEIEIMTILQGSAICEEIEVKSGMSVIILPGEQIVNMDVEKCIIVRLTR